MALTSTRSADFPILADGQNVVPGVPKSGYTAAQGHLVKREFAQNDEWDLCANTEVPAGLVLATPGNGTISIAELKDGVTLILQHDGSIVAADLGKTVTATATALGTTISRTVVQDGGAWSAGLPLIVAVDPRGTNTVEVLFF